jgi:1-acyl-sn-glycerol-3-phosphate acyltransferase
MAKKEIFNHKIAGPLMRGMHHINVDRSNGGPSFDVALKALKSGEIIGIFPEATISVSFEIKEIKSGTIRLAIESGAPVIPTIIWGSQRVITKGLKPNFKRNHFPISVVCGDPISYPPTANVEQSQLHLRKVMLDLLHQVQQSYPDNHAGQRWAPARLGGTAPAPLN